MKKHIFDINKLVVFNILAFLLNSVISSAQLVDVIQGQYIIQLEEHITITDLNLPTHARSKKSTFSWTKIQNSPLNLHILNVDYTQIGNREVLEIFKNNKLVKHIQEDKIISYRQIPNDTFYSRQWQFNNLGQNNGTVGADMNAEQAWNITTGGVTAHGDTIVVCVIDDGAQINHPDLASNIWVNHDEIPGDGIDNDDNGFIDDINGWNFQENNNDLSIGASHGTPVAGIVGAVGNNSIGVTGVNWNVKIMALKSRDQISESSVIQAYSYAYEKRKTYNLTNGEQGAFVVATNASWGIDAGNPDDSPIWCSFYDSLGVIGILNCGATANENFNVDEVGDLPTACSSDYLIAVTNMNKLDLKVNDAGFGRTTIDIGAHGREAYTISYSNYGEFGGTSGATPHVAGAIGLLYAVPCNELIDLAKVNPGLAAIAVKELLLNNVDKISSLEGLTTSGGRLNLGNAVTKANALCDSDGDTYGFDENNENLGRTIITWFANKSGLTTDIRYRKFEESNWNEILNVTSSVKLENLDVCTLYEYQVRSYSLDDPADYGFSRFFETKGCCYESDVIFAEAENGLLTIELSNEFDSAEHRLEWRLLGEPIWNTITTDNKIIIISDLADCSLIEYRYQALCQAYNTVSDTVGTLFIGTPCGACTSNEYCTPSSFNNDTEWIASIEINGERFDSGKGNGYQELTGGFVPSLLVGAPTLVTCTPEYSGQKFRQNFVVYVDLNSDGEFDEMTEKVYAPDRTTTSAIEDTLLIPVGTSPGLTRMRVMMSASRPSAPCGNPNSRQFGEVEDYCVLLTNSLNTDFAKTALSLEVRPNISENQFKIIIEHSGYGTIEVVDMQGQVVYVYEGIIDSTFNLEGSNWSSGTYIVRHTSGDKLSVARVVKF